LNYPLDIIMGVWCDYCLVCGGPFKNYVWDDDEDDEITYSECAWLCESYTIDEDEGLHKTGLVDCGTPHIGHEETNFHTCPQNWTDWDSIKPAVACHRVCFKLIKKELGYRIKFADVKELLDDLLCVLADKKSYGKMHRYSFGQEFESKAFAKDLWLLTNPMTNDKNKARIIKTWTPVVEQFNG
jgi:hypothetical protein